MSALSGRDFGYTFESGFPPESLVNAYYFGFSNQVLWPLFHDSRPVEKGFSPDYWNAYQKVNEIFCPTIAQNIKSQDDHIWVHDYHLMGVGWCLAKIKRKPQKSDIFCILRFP